MTVPTRKPSPAAIRQRRHRSLKAQRVRWARLRVSEPFVGWLVEAGFMKPGPWRDEDIERALYFLLNVARDVRITVETERTQDREFRQLH